MNNLAPLLSFNEPNLLVVFGLILVVGIFGGMLAHRVSWMPTITAFMLVGFVLGPHGAGLINKDMMSGAMVLVDIALGLILYKLGNMLHPLMLLRSRVTFVSLLEVGLTFVAVFVIIAAFGYSLIVAALVAAIAMSSSPAVLVHVAEELHADGPITDRAKSLVAMNNLMSFVAFTLVLPLALTTNKDTLLDIVLVPAYRLVMAAVLGTVIAWVSIQGVRVLHGSNGEYRFPIVVGAIMLTLGLSEMLGASPLFSTMCLGMATRWFERRSYRLSDVSLGEGGDLFFIILFVIAGAKIDPSLLATVGILPAALVVTRIFGKVGGVFLARRITGYTVRESKALSMLLVPMAGMAIGLVTTLNEMVPALGLQIGAIVFVMVAIFETIGPFAAVAAFRMSGEAGRQKPESPAGTTGPV